MNNPLRKRLNWRVLVNVITYTGILTGVTLLVSAVIKWLIVSFFNKRDKTPSQRSANNAGQDTFQIYVPIPWFNNKPLVPQALAPRITKQASDGAMTDNDKQQQQRQEQDDSSIQRAMSEDPSNYMVQYLNHISQAFDFLHKNYMHYRLKNLTQIPAYVLQKRLKVIMIEQKVELAKELLMQDLTDFIEKCNLQILIQKQQIRELRRRLPPRLPFLLKNKYAPYFWILTDLDYTQMNPALRNVLLYNTSNMASRSSMYGGYTYDRSERFQFTEQDEAELDYFLFINPNTTIPQRYKKLKAVWAQKEGVSHVIESEQRELFAKYCFRLLKKRARLIVKKIRRIRRIDMRNTIRERSKYITELSLCGRLQLRRNVPQQDI